MKATRKTFEDSWKQWAAICTLIVTWCCIATGCGMPLSGGGFYHKPPPQFHFDKKTALEFKMIIRGIQGDIATRYTNCRLHYRVGNDAQYISAEVTDRVDSDEDGEILLITATIPPISPKQGNRIDYYFTYEFDGVAKSFGSADHPKSISNVR